MRKTDNQGRQRSVTSSLLLAGLMVQSVSVNIAHATMTPSLERGEQSVLIDVPGKPNLPEVCIIPKHSPLGKYSKKDLKDEQDLCALSAYSTSVVCPKDNSTNPGLNFWIGRDENVDYSKAKDCFIPDAKDPKKNALKKMAKYKLSTSCSYTPSIAAYYHVSRILGNVVNVEPAVIRTFDLDNHKVLADEGVKTTRPKSGEPEPLIHTTWKSLRDALYLGSKTKRKDLLFTDDFKQSYGALTKTAKGESFYSEMFNKGTNRAAAFRDNNPIYKTLKSQKDLSALVGKEFNQENVQRIVQLKDVSDMILLDHILGQKDRFGNIHGEDKYYFLDHSDLDKQGNPKVKSEGKLKKDEIEQLKPLVVKEMVLKDNDCGIVKGNVAKTEGLLKGVAHMDPKTYQRLLQWNAVADEPEHKAVFKPGLMFTESDFKTVRADLKDAVQILQSACRAGKLKLDLDLEAHFGGNKKATSCELEP